MRGPEKMMSEKEVTAEISEVVFLVAKRVRMYRKKGTREIEEKIRLLG